MIDYYTTMRWSHLHKTPQTSCVKSELGEEDTTQKLEMEEIAIKMNKIHYRVARTSKGKGHTRNVAHGRP